MLFMTSAAHYKIWSLQDHLFQQHWDICHKSLLICSQRPQRQSYQYDHRCQTGNTFCSGTEWEISVCLSVFTFWPMSAYQNINPTKGILLWPPRKSCIPGISKPSDVGIWHFNLYHKSMLLMHPCFIQLYYCT